MPKNIGAPGGLSHLRRLPEFLSTDRGRKKHRLLASAVLNENGPSKLIYLNIWSLVRRSGKDWGCGFFGGGMSLVLGFEFFKSPRYSQLVLSASWFCFRM